MTALSVLVGSVVTLGMFWVVPTGLALLEGPRPPGWDLLRRSWPLFAVPGGLALWLPRSGLSTALAAVYALATLALALQAPARLFLTRSLRPGEVAVLTALVAPSVGGLALVAERAAFPLFGFDLDILALTVPHFHFAGFAAALVAGLLCRASDGPTARFAALSVPAGTLLVLLGYFVDDWAEFAGAVVLTAGMTAVAFLTLRERRETATDRLTRGLLAVSALVLFATMLLALSWALGEATGLPHLDLTWTAATHGLGNALGFTVCALLAHRRLRSRRPTPPAPPTPAQHGPPANGAPDMTRLLNSLSRPDRPRPALSYREVGATRTPAALPEGYHLLRYSTVVGHGRAAFETAGAAVTTWRMHRATGARLLADAEHAEPGVAVEISAGIGRLRVGAPCSVIWTAYEEDRVGFAYGTLTGHPECGEESFMVHLEPDGTVRFAVTAFSRPAAWYTRLGGPVVPLLQRAYARRLGQILRRLVRS